MTQESFFILKARMAKPSWWRQFRTEMEHEIMSPEALHDFNFRLRLDLLSFAFENSPFYHNLYTAAGLEPGDVKTEKDWQKIPMLTREALRFNFDTIKIYGLDKRGRYKLYTTGGSTGEPSKVLKDDDFSSVALNWRAMKWAGCELGGNSATIMRTHGENWKANVRHFLANFPSVNIMLDAGNMTDETVSRFFNQWRRHKPVRISSYVGGIHQLALFCLEHHVELPPPQAIFTTAAPLTAVVKNDISKAFHCPVFDNYVATEAHPMANQCRCLAEQGSTSLHIHSDYRHLEFVDEQGLSVPEGEYGDILVTDCGDRVFPIIRYRLGDRGCLLKEKCACGRPYPLMGAIHGRSFDFIYLEHGRLMGECWATAFDHCLNAIHNFQIHQFKDKTVTLSVVMNKDYPEAEKCIRLVAADLQRQLDTIPLRLEFKDFIPHNRGKIKYIISDVKS
ncbi:MAG: phenylacetate--CoA ligase family protein [Fibrobacter sp.]|nr:phenylacetate--CoA ligase family protein [Fibrobacter sp.]